MDDLIHQAQGIADPCKRRTRMTDEMLHHNRSRDVRLHPADPARQPAPLLPAPRPHLHVPRLGALDHDVDGGAAAAAHPGATGRLVGGAAPRGAVGQLQDPQHAAQGHGELGRVLGQDGAVVGAGVGRAQAVLERVPGDGGRGRGHGGRGEGLVG